eukprot:1191179-Amphidinium_carterae.1
MLAMNTPTHAFVQALQALQALEPKWLRTSSSTAVLLCRTRLTKLLHACNAVQADIVCLTHRLEVHALHGSVLFSKNYLQLRVPDIADVIGKSRDTL